MTRTHPLPRNPIRHRLSVASRTVAATAGGYALASLAAAVLALALPLPREEAVTAGALVAFLLLPLAAVGCFATSSARRAWLCILVPGIALALAFWWLRGG